MSYEKCKYISLDKKHNKIMVNIASNNIRPLYWCKCELCADSDFENYTFDDKMLIIFVDMQQGNIQISTINKNTLDFVYAMRKVREYHRENNIDSYEDLYEECSRIFEKNKELKRIEVYRQVYGRSFEMFMKALKEKIDGDYKVCVYSNYYVSKLGKYDRGYMRFYYGGNPLKMNYKQAYILLKDMQNENRGMRIEKFESEVA